MTAQTTRTGAAPAAHAGLVAALALVLGLTLALLTGADRGVAAAPASKGHATLALTGSAGKALSTRGVKASAKGGATLKKGTATLPVSVAVVSGGAAVGLKGTVSFKSGKRTATFTGLRVAVTKKRALTVTATLAGKRVTFLTGKAPASGFALDQTYGTAAFAASSIAMPKSVAQKMRTTLKLKRTPTGRVGTLVLVAPPKAPPTMTTPDVVTVPTTPPPTTTPAGTPSTTVAVTAGSLVWHPRDSWTNYVNSGEGASLANGATGETANTACGNGGGIGAVKTREFRFPLRSGTYDAATGRADLQFAGTLRYRYTAHSLDVSFVDPGVVLGPTNAVSFSGSAGRFTGFDADPLTAPLAKQCPSDPGPQGLHAPSAHAYERVPITLSADAASMFDGGTAGGPSGIYAAGTPFGWITVSFTPAS